MKQLYLLRHAQAIGTDYSVPLTIFGIKEASRVGEYLLDNHIIPELVLCSGATRAAATCDIIFDKLENKPNISISDELYAATVNELLNVIKVTSLKVNSLMVIGHNPGITALLTELKHIEYGQFYAKALDTTITCKLVSIMVSSNTWLNLKNAPCIIDNVYYPNSRDILGK